MYIYSFLSCIARNKQVLIHLCIAITNQLCIALAISHCKMFSIFMTGSSPGVSSMGR